jgi:hypothetical protein
VSCVLTRHFLLPQKIHSGITSVISTFLGHSTIVIVSKEVGLR